jgi:hypothetical protein
MLEEIQKLIELLENQAPIAYNSGNWPKLKYTIWTTDNVTRVKIDNYDIIFVFMDGKLQGIVNYKQ